MAKSSKYGKPSGGEVLAIKCHKNGQIFIGSPNRMFQYDDCPEQARRVSTLFGISEPDLKKQVQKAREQSDNFVFVTL